MNKIIHQVSRVRKRLVMEQALRIIPWCLFAGLIVGLIGLLIPRFWYLQVDQSQWQMGWLIG